MSEVDSGKVKLELAFARNYTLVLPDGPRKGVAMSFKEGIEYEVDNATAEVLLAKVDPNGNDIFTLVLPEEDEPEEGAEKVSLVEKKTKEAAARNKQTKARRKAKKGAEGKKVDPKTMEVKATGKSKKKKPSKTTEIVAPADDEDANEGIPKELLEID